jgi:triosephosphate isomerase
MAIANWKMSFTLAQCQDWLSGFDLASAQLGLADGLTGVDGIVCPAYTALAPLAPLLQERGLQMAAQNIAETEDPARMGQVSAELVADVGCRWSLLGHWELRRYLGETDEAVNRKVALCFRWGLRPVLLVGEGTDEEGSRRQILFAHLDRILAGCTPQQVAQAALIYEPETAIGQGAPASPQEVAEGCGLMREWLAQRHGSACAASTPIVYGGSVAPDLAGDLLTIPDLNGLAATRQGRDPRAFARLIGMVSTGFAPSSK